MPKMTFKRIFPIVVLVLLCIPIATSSLLDLEQKEKQKAVEEKVHQEEQARLDAAEKIYLLGQFDQSARDDFELIPSYYVLGGGTMYLRNETLEAFIMMRNASAEDGVELYLASATRNFDYQKNLWDNKWTGATLVEGKSLAKSTPDGLTRFKKILEYSAAPGTSRHHWGTDIDLNNANPEYFDTEIGEKVYDWLVDNASRFGFCQPYNEKGPGRPTGYNEEKWHWSYMPLSKKFTQDYKRLITSADIEGFAGDQYASEINLISDYVLGINPDCI